MSRRGETWIKLDNGWRTTKTIIICNNPIKSTRSPNSSDSEEEYTSLKLQNVTGIYWMMGPSYVMLPNNTRNNAVVYCLFREINYPQEQSGTCPSLMILLSKLRFRSSVKDIRRMNYVVKIIEIALSKDLLFKNASSQKKLFNIFDVLVNTVLSREQHIHTAKKLLKLLKMKHLSNKASQLNQKVWSHQFQQLVEWDMKLRKFQVKKVFKGRSNTKLILTDVPVEVLRLLLRCFSDHRDVIRVSLTCRLLNKLANEVDIWRKLSHYHLSSKQLKEVHHNIPSSWKNVYKKRIKPNSMREPYADMLQICSYCHFIFWQGTVHECTFKYNNMTTNQKVPILIPITVTGFFYLFEE